jgi:hypothetical protein
MTDYNCKVPAFRNCTNDILHCCNDPCLYAQVIAAVKNIDAPMLMRVWQEVEYRIDVCRVTRGVHIKHF